MEQSSVASWRRRCVAPLGHRVALVLIAALACAGSGCRESKSPTSPSGGGKGTTPSTVDQTGIVEGTVHDSSGPVANALVEVTATPGGAVTTGTNGSFLFRLPAGITRLRSSRSGYYPRESDVVVPAGGTATVDVVLESIAGSPPPSKPPYTVRGVVRNGRGVTVPGAEVWIYGNGSPIDNRYGTTSTDANGFYSVTSPQRVPQSVRVLKDGHIPRDLSILGSPDAPSTWTVDAVLVHIDRYSLNPVPPLAVNRAVRLEARTDLDDGSSRTGFLYMQLTSSNPQVLQVEPSGWVQGVGAGTATVTATYYGVTATLTIQVE